MSDQPPKFELVPTAEAVTEKKIGEHLKIIRLSINGNRRARNLFFAYAAIAGAHANALMELAPHGSGEKLLAQEFDDTPESTLKDWRAFARDLAPELAKRPTVGLLTAPVFGKKTLPAKQCEAIQEAVLEILDGKTMVKFMRSCRALREAKKEGGFRPNWEVLQAWIKERHAGFLSIPFDELPEDVQKAFRQQYKQPRPSAEELDAIERESWADDAERLYVRVVEKTYTSFGPEHVKQLGDIQKVLHDTNQALLGYLAKLKASADKKSRANPAGLLDS